MEVKQQVENLIEQLRPLMPSNGTWPFTLMRLDCGDFNGTGVERAVTTDHQIIFLLRTDFVTADLVDYVRNTAEFTSIPRHKQDDFLIEYVAKVKGDSALLNWCERTTNIGIGIAIGLAEQLGLRIEFIAADLFELDMHFGFQTRNLSAFQLFDIHR